MKWWMKKLSSSDELDVKGTITDSKYLCSPGSLKYGILDFRIAVTFY